MRTMQGFVPGVLCGDEDFVNLESIADGERGLGIMEGGKDGIGGFDV